MTVRIEKPAFNLRDKLSELDKPVGLKGSELMKSETSQEARDFIGAGRKNKIINGAMLVSQRRGTSSHTDSNGFHTDRFRTQVSGMDQLVQTYQQVSDGPPGFPRSLKITTTTPETAIASSSEYLAVYQKIEGQNLQDFAYGTTSAKTITVSFYVKSSITGQFSYTVYRNESTDRAINKPYTINNANTWERKTITIEGDTVQAIGNGTGDNWWNVWILASSPGYMSAETSVWANYASGTNWAGFHKQNGVITTNGATWQITGVQIEVGENATDFEHLSYAEDLALCQRYYWKPHGTHLHLGMWGHGVADTSGIRFQAYPWPVQMRTAPSLSYDDNAGNSSRVHIEHPDKTDHTNINVSWQVTSDGTDGGFKYPYGISGFSNGQAGDLIAYNFEANAEH